MSLDRPPSRPPAAERRTRRADRWRRYRARVRDGRMVPELPDIGAEEISFLIETRWLAEADAADRRAVGCAIARLLEDAARHK